MTAVLASVPADCVPAARCSCSCMALHEMQNSSIEADFPPDQYRDDVGGLWYADVSTSDGTLQQLLVTPTRLK